jgi:hypothetical protein
VSPTGSTTTYTLGAVLERDRLEHRVSQVAVAVAVLRQLAALHRREPGPPPMHIRRAIADFESQAATIDARLQELAHAGGPNPVPEWSGSHANVR